MPLSEEQIACLRAAITNYAFPPAYYDYGRDTPVVGLTMTQVEKRIRDHLLGGAAEVKDGLSNVLYWGFAQMGGLAGVRVDRFRAEVTRPQLEAAARLFHERDRPTASEIASLKMPQFSGLSFVSKVRMFLDPERSATLDLQIMKMRQYRAGTVLSCVVVHGTTIRVTRGNSAAYEAWCERLAHIQRTYLSDLRVVDVERGLFHLVQCGLAARAAEILDEA